MAIISALYLKRVSSASEEADTNVVNWAGGIENLAGGMPGTVISNSNDLISFDRGVSIETIKQSLGNWNGRDGHTIWVP